MESGNRDLMNMLLHGGSSENGSQQPLESFGQPYTSPASMSGHTSSMQPPLSSPMGQQSSPFHGQMMPQSPMMQQSDMMSTSYSQPPTSYSDTTYQGYPGYTQQRMSLPQGTSSMYPNYGQNGSFLSSLGVGQFGTQSRAMGQYPPSTSSVGFGPPNYYSEVFPSVPPKSPASHQQLQGSAYPNSLQGPMQVGGNGSSYPGSGYTAQSSMSPLQKPMGQSFFPPRSPASQQIHSPPTMASSFPGQPPTSPMQQPIVGHPRRSSTSPVSPMVAQGLPVYSMPQRQQYPTTTSTMSPNQLQSSCMFAQRLEKMSAQHQYQTQMQSSNLPGPTASGVSPSRRPPFPGQQSHVPGMHPMKTSTGPGSPVQRSPPQIGKSSPPFKPLRSPPPYQAHKSPPSFQKTPTSMPLPYPPQAASEARKQEKSAAGSVITAEGGQPPSKKARKSKNTEKSSMQKLEEVTEKVYPHLAEGLSHAVGDAIDQKQNQVNTKANVTEGDCDDKGNPKGTTDSEDKKADKSSPEDNSEKSKSSPEGNTEQSKLSPEGNTKKSKPSPEGNTKKSKPSPEGNTKKSKPSPEGNTKKSKPSPEGNTKKSKPSPEGNTKQSKPSPEGNTKQSKPSPEGNTKKSDVQKSYPTKYIVPKSEIKDKGESNSVVSKKDEEIVDNKEKDKPVKDSEDVSVKKEENPKALCASDQEKNKGCDKEDSSNDTVKQHSSLSKDDIVFAVKKEKESQDCEHSNKNKDKNKDISEKKSVANQAGPVESRPEKEKKNTPEKSESTKGVSSSSETSLPDKTTTKYDTHKKYVEPFKDFHHKTLISKSMPKPPGTKVSISRSGHPPTIQATVIAKGQSAQSNQQVLVAKTAAGQMYLIQGNVLIPVQNITVQQPNGEKGNKVICVNQGQGKSSHVMVGNITPNLTKKTDKFKPQARKYDVDDDDDDSDDELSKEMAGNMEIDLACREKALLSPTAEMAENEAGTSSFDSHRSTVSSQTERHILKSRFSRPEGERSRFGAAESAKLAASKASNLEKSLNAIKAKLELEQHNQRNQREIEMKKRISRPPGSKDKIKGKSYLYSRPIPEQHGIPQKTGFSTVTTSVSSSERKDTLSEQSQSRKRPHSINIHVPTVSKASRTVSKRPKMVPPPHSPTRTLLVQPRGGVDGDKWVCSFCGKPSNHSFLGVLYGPYKVKLSRERTDNSRDCRSPEKVLSPGGRLPELPTELEGSTIELWMHKDCGMWSQGVYMLGRSLYGLEQAVESAASHKCSKCMELGATMQCFKRGCTSIFHFACARDSGCAFVEENFTIFCSVHK